MKFKIGKLQVLLTGPSGNCRMPLDFFNKHHISKTNRKGFNHSREKISSGKSRVYFFEFSQFEHMTSKLSYYTSSDFGLLPLNQGKESREKLIKTLLKLNKT